MFVTLVIFLCVTACLWAGFELVSSAFSAESTKLRKRLDREFQKATEQAAPNLFKNAEDLNLDDVHEDPKTNLPMRPRIGFRAHMESLLEQAEVSFTLNRLVGIMLALSFAAGAGGFWVGGTVLCVAAALVVGAAPALWVYYRVHKRRDKMLRQLPAAFELMARVLRSGSSVQNAVQAVGNSMETPLAAEFASCEQQLDMGMPPELTYEWLAHRCPIVELRIFAMGMRIQRQTGGSLSEVLERLAALLRARLKLRQQVKTLTAEGRMQGRTLLALPFVVFGVMWIVNHEYAATLLAHPSLLVATGVSMLLGTLWIRKIVNFEP